MVKKGKDSTSLRSRKAPSHRDLVKTVSKQLKYYFEIKRQEDGFDLSGPECPRADYPALKSRPMLLYEGLHDRSVKHFYSDQDVKQRITHMRTYNTSTGEAKKTEKLMKKTMDRVSYVPPWMGVGMNGGNTKYTKNSEKYVSGTLGEWSVKPKKNRRKGYGNPEPKLQTAFAEPEYAKPRVRRSCPSGWIDNRECGRLITGASRILASSEFRDATSRPHSSKSSSHRSTETRELRARSASPQPAASTTVSTHTTVKRSSQPRLMSRPQSGQSSIHRKSLTYHEARDDVVRQEEHKKTSQNLHKGRIYYDIDGRRKPVPHVVKNKDGYLEREDRASPHPSDSENRVPDWLRTQMRRQDVEEKKMPYNKSVRSVEISEPNTARGEDVSKREGVRLRPKSAKRTKSRAERDDGDRDSHITLSEGSYEMVTSEDYNSGEEAYYEDRACQTGWELFVQYDQTDNVLYDGEGEATRYKIIVRTGRSVGASTSAPVYLILYGSRGRTPDLPLTDCDNHKILFQQAASDIFYVTCSYVGSLKRIDIGHNSDSDAWYLDSVTVHDPTKGEAYEFLCAKWLSVKADDKKTRRQLEITATRRIESDGDVTDDEEEEEVTPEVTPSPAEPVGKADTESSVVSTSHLRNESNTIHSEDNKEMGSVVPPSDTGSTVSVEEKAKGEIAVQHPFVVSRSNVRDRRTPDVPEDFESDITLPSVKKSVASRRSGSPVSGSENLTARFEERSVLSESTLDGRQQYRQQQEQQQELDRLEAFKAGQRAERERQRLVEEKNKKAEEEEKADIFRGTSIHHAAKGGDLARVKDLLDHNSQLMDSVDSHGNTPVLLAAFKGHKEVVQLLAASGADLQLRNQLGQEPVHIAALNGHVGCLMVLVAMGASIHSKTDDCKLPMHLAAVGGNMETCKWLVANRSRLDDEDDFGRTPVDMADNNGHDHVAMFLRTCINELKERRTSLESLLSGTDNWKDDKPERPIVQHKGENSDDEMTESVADLRRDTRAREEKEAKQRAYAEMQQQLASSEMTYLDRIRYEVDNS